MSSVKPLFKQNQVVVVLAGRFSGQKGYVSYVNEQRVGVAIIRKAPRAITKSMTPEQIQKRTELKVVLKEISPKHLIPTRYAIKDAEATPIKSEVFEAKNVEQKKAAEQAIAEKLTKAYRAGSDSFIFKRLRF